MQKTKPNQPCPCGSNKKYKKCCGVIIAETKKAETPEQLMRSRYTAYTQANMTYIQASQSGPAALKFNLASSLQWAESVQWLSLVVKKSWLESNTVGFVEFVVSFQDQSGVQHMHDVSEFRLQDGSWFYFNSQD